MTSASSSSSSARFAVAHNWRLEKHKFQAKVEVNELEIVSTATNTVSNGIMDVANTSKGDSPNLPLKFFHE